MLELIAAIDERIAVALQASLAPWMLCLASLVSGWHAAWPLHAATLGLGLLLWRKGERWACWLLPAVPLAALLNHILKHLIRHPRPGPAGLALQTDYGFPSGHVAHAAAFYGVLALLVVLRSKRRSTGIAAVLVAASMVALVGSSRLALGVHHFSDVVGALVEVALWLAGYAWLTRSHWQAGLRARCGSP